GHDHRVLRSSSGDPEYRRLRPGRRVLGFREGSLALTAGPMSARRRVPVSARHRADRPIPPRIPSRALTGAYERVAIVDTPGTRPAASMRDSEPGSRLR